MKWHELSVLFLIVWEDYPVWSSMGVFDKARNVSHLGEPTGRPYICLACEASFDLQHHACPDCGGYDIRRAKWVE